MTRPLDFPPTVPNLLRRSAERFGGRDYVITPDRRLTFADADARSRQLAKRLLASGVGKGTRVGMLFPQGADFVIAFLGITRIGAVAVPLSTFSRPPELRRGVRHVDVGLDGNLDDAVEIIFDGVFGRDDFDIFGVGEVQS